MNNKNADAKSGLKIRGIYLNTNEIKIALCCSNIDIIADVFGKIACISKLNDCILSPFKCQETKYMLYNQIALNHSFPFLHEARLQRLVDNYAKVS